MEKAQVPVNSGDQRARAMGSSNKADIIDQVKSFRYTLDFAKKKVAAADEGKKSQINADPILSRIPDEVDKLCKELDYIKGSLENLRKFQTDLTKPLNTLQTNINDIDLGIENLVGDTDVSLGTRRREIQGNISVLRSNITKLKIKIPLQHQPSISTSEAGRDFQKTIASSQFGELPSLCERSKLEGTPFFREIRRMFETDLVAAADDKRPATELETMRMQLCLVCFAVFPEDAEIRRRLLHLWWIGEDLLPEDEDKPAEFADTALKRFVELGLIEPVKEESRPEKDSAKSFKMHPLIRAALIKLAERAKFFDFDEKGNPLRNSSKSKRACLVKKTVEEEEEKEEAKTKSESSKPTASDDPRKLKTLFNVSEQFPDLRIRTQNLLKMKEIGVVYYGRWEGTAKRHIEVESVDFLRALRDKKKLRCLSLQGLSRITDIPSFGVGLKNLTILDLRACYNLEQLPKDLDFLRRLTYLDISECYLLDFMPRSLALLPELKVLKGFVVSDRWKSCTLHELAVGLKKLEKLGIIINTHEFKVKELGEELLEFKALKKLKIAWGARPLANENKEDKNDEAATEESKIDEAATEESELENKDKKEGKKKRCLWWKRGGESTSKKNKEDGEHPTSGPTTVVEDCETHGATSASRPVTAADNKSPDVHQKNHETATEESNLENKEKKEDFETHGTTAASRPVTAADNESPDVHQKNHTTTAEESNLGNKDKKEDGETHGTTATSGPITAADNESPDVHQKNHTTTAEESNLGNKEKKEDGETHGATAARRPITAADNKSPDVHQKNHTATAEESKLGNKDKKEDGENHEAIGASGLVIASKGIHLDVAQENHDTTTKKFRLKKKDKKKDGEEVVNKPSPENNRQNELLQKLDLESYPDSELQDWMGPKFLINLEKLYIKGGNLKSVVKGEEKWTVKVLRLKYLNDLKMDWKQMQELFPDLKYLEKVKCPKITQCPCDGNGVWIKS